MEHSFVSIAGLAKESAHLKGFGDYLAQLLIHPTWRVQVIKNIQQAE